MAVLRDHGLAEYFVYPQMSWQPKSEGIAQIATLLTLALTRLPSSMISRSSAKKCRLRCPRFRSSMLPHAPKSPHAPNARCLSLRRARTDG